MSRFLPDKDCRSSTCAISPAVSINKISSPTVRDAVSQSVSRRTSNVKGAQTPSTCASRDVSKPQKATKSTESNAIDKLPRIRIHINSQIFSERTASVYSASLVESPHRELVLKLSNMSINPVVEDELRHLYKEVARLRNKRLLKVYSLSLLENQRAIVTERCKGPSLIEWVTKCYRKGLSENYARTIMKQILEGLSALHEIGIVHRDVKLDNLMFLDKDLRRVVVIDFDTMSSLDKNATPHLSARPAGTLEYMAPECVEDYSITDAPRDLWALGVAMFGLLTGSFPYHPRKSDRASLRECFKKEPVLKVELSPIAKEFLYGLLCRDPGKRLTAAQALSHPFISDSS